VVGADARSVVSFDTDDGDPLLQKSVVQQELLRHGVLWSGFHNLSFSHSDADIAHVLAAYGHALDVLAFSIGQGDLAGALQGRPVRPVFGKTPGS
jgi:acetate kinase